MFEKIIIQLNSVVKELKNLGFVIKNLRKSKKRVSLKENNTVYARTDEIMKLCASTHLD